MNPGKRVCLKCESDNIMIQSWPEKPSNDMENLTIQEILIHCNSCGFGGGCVLSRLKDLNTSHMNSAV